MRYKLIVLLIAFTCQFGITQAQVKRYEANKQYSWITYKITHPLHEVEATSKNCLCLINADVKAKQVKQVLFMVAVTSFSSGNSNRD